MKNLFKKLTTAVVSVAVAVASVFSMASCDNTETGAFKVGGSGPLTGDNASYGISVKQGALLAVEHLNAKGGVQFDFDMKDDQCDPQTAGQNYDTLYDWGMQLSLSAVTSGAALSFAEKANADKLFSMSPSASADNVIQNKDYSFRLCFGDPDQGILAAQMIAENYENVGCLYNEADSYSKGVYDAFAAEMQRLQKSYKVYTFDNENNKDFSTQASQLADCDVIFMPFYYTEASLFAKAIVAKDSDAVLFGCDGFDGIADLIEGVDNKIMYITPFDVKSQETDVKAFVEAYTAKYGVAPDQFAADAYDVIMVLAKAIETAGVTDTSISAAELGEKLLEVITSDTFSYTGLTGVMSWDESGACTKEPVIVEFN